ncbi:MAG: hypothetical protein PHW16_05290 [Candidatus Methanomethylophilaceae archaeon]|jgi:hypothetical protein|nr:hypothetical protein [Candidatus Methanomethylophilaceae archaeon]MDD4454752.1 hypothetical protein [Candidatus Methanomethylophilaceae archaeon]
MALIRNRKGMLSSLDAMIFLSVMVLVSAGLFAYASFEDPETITSKDVADSFFSAELRASDLYPTEDDQTAPICDILAACINSGNLTKAKEYTEKVMRDLIPRHSSFLVEMEFNGKVLTAGAAGSGVSSYYETEYATAGGPLKVVVCIY